jgi:hypothetical protein
LLSDLLTILRRGIDRARVVPKTKRLPLNEIKKINGTRRKSIIASEIIKPTG